MSELQLSLIAAGVVVIAGVVAYNMAQERAARRRAEQAFRAKASDALLDERREPTMGSMPPDSATSGEEAPPRSAATAQPLEAAQELLAAGGPEAEISSRLDTVAVILADDPVTSEQLEALRMELAALAAPVRIEGIVNEQWHPVDAAPLGSWRELRVGMQLASRKGAMAEADVEAFNAAIADFAAGVNAVSQREAPASAAARARLLDAFAAEADIEVVLHVVGQFGAALSLARVRQLASDAGLAETAEGERVFFGADGTPEFRIRRLEDPARAATPNHLAGLTFAIDVPHVADPVTVLGDMARLAAQFAAALGGLVVDDNRKPLGDTGIALIRRSLEPVLEAMQAQGIPAGSALARRLFA